MSAPPRAGWLPAPGSMAYHLLLAAAGMLVLGPLAGLTAAYMNFSLGFFVGGQVLAGLLGSAVTAGYGAAGKHGANYIQTAAASVASMSGMAVLVQAMAWMGMGAPPTAAIVVYLLCVGMFGVGVGMLCTPLLVDRMQLPYPSGLAVANILRALTDPQLLRSALGRLAAGVGAGLASGLAASRVALLGAVEFSGSTFGAGLVVGARIGIPVVLGGLASWAAQPWFVAAGWLQPGDPFRKITFLIALGLILGAAIVDLALVFVQALERLRGARAVEAVQADWQRVHRARLVIWVLAWAAGVVLSGHLLLAQPIGFLAFAVGLVFIFAIVNGIATGVSDANPISSAFVVAVLLMAGLGLRDPLVGLMAGTVLLVATSVACDMQQDRSTGWRLGTNRVVQFRYQVLGIVVGALLAVAFARLFMAAYPVLLQDQTVMKEGEQPAGWSSAMTYKFVGALRSLTDPKPHQHAAIGLGIALGFAIEVARKRVFRSDWSASRPRLHFVTDAILLPSPYAFSFGGFVNLPTSAWFGAGSIAASLLEKLRPPREDVPQDMSTSSLLGGGLIAGDALAALAIGVMGLVAALG